ncbi:MAG: hypothetical protein KDC92_01055 [Bacteroidetes bacterium]|nr:hypothetical protein [Bacteroidota bacterium]
MSNKLGINTSNIFLLADTNQLPVISNFISSIGTHLFRFPGGTTANFYHPKMPGYGYNRNDLNLVEEGPIKKHMSDLMAAVPQNLNDVKFIDLFANWAAKEQYDVLYVANLFSGTIDEILFALQTLCDNNVSIKGIELGNEYYLRAYNRIFPDAQSYIQKAKAFAEAIKLQFPNIPVSLTVAPTKTTKQLSQKETNWNKQIGHVNFYDAVSLHYYPIVNRVSDKNIQPCTFDESWEMGERLLTKTLAEIETTFSKPIWISEWNVMGGNKWCNNSVEHAYYTLLFLQRATLNTRVEYIIYHTVIGKGTGFNLLKPIGALIETNFNVFPLQIWNMLNVHLAKNDVDFAEARTSNFHYATFKSTANKSCLWGVNFNQENFEMNINKQSIQHYEINASGLTKKKVMDDKLTFTPKTLNMVLFQQ